MKLKQAIVITGAGQRIGLALAQHLIQQRPHPIVFTYRSLKPGVEQLLAAGAVGFQVDFNHPDAVKHLMPKLTEQVGSLRALIHNASLWWPDSAPDALQKQFDVHVRAPYELNQACLPLLQACQSEQKDIISISDARVSQGHPSKIAYLATKAALENMTLSFAQAFAPDVKVNAIAPALLTFHPQDSAAYRQARLDRLLLPMEPGAQVLCHAVDYLLDNPYTTGTILPLDGGSRLVGQRLDK
ncbi:short-chain dehydrogenase [Thiomicrospira aerophila AL3]|uniref:Short-chain dehydrogenase n=1 Tax=Thiomicrospira aerophila AL3 TaxID=717772 RepID=W0DUH5_9GAMM|nr:dihydromonapterin reductase [Thiomicrospira aerophila]AHF00644.1 short-chain dehydrogenase [Thiomicrospira aerophila AL3]